MMEALVTIVANDGPYPASTVTVYAPVSVRKFEAANAMLAVVDSGIVTRPVIPPDGVSTDTHTLMTPVQVTRKLVTLKIEF